MKTRTLKILISAILVVAIGASFSCKKLFGGGGGKSDHTSYIPSDAPMAVIFPKVSTFVGKLKDVKDMAAEANPMIVDMIVGGMVEKMGFDPFNPEDLRKNGINPDKGIAFTTIISEGVEANFVVVIPTDDHAALRALIEKYAALQSDGAATFEKDGDTHKIELMGETLYMGEEKGYALISNSPDAISSASKLKAKDSLSESKGYKKCLEKIGSASDLIIYQNTQSYLEHMESNFSSMEGAEAAMQAQVLKSMKSAMTSLFGGMGESVTGISLNGKRLSAVSFSLVEDTSKIEFMTKSSGGSVKMMNAIGGKAIIAGKIIFDLPGLVQFIEDEIINKDENLKAQYNMMLPMMEAQSQLSLKDDLLVAIQGDPILVVHSLGKGPSAKPKFVAAVKTKDSAKAAELLSKIAGMMGAKAKPYNGVDVYDIKAPDMRLNAAIVGEHIVIATGKERMNSIIDNFASGEGKSFVDGIVHAKSQESFKNEEGSVIYVDGSEILSSIMASIPDDKKMQADMIIGMAGGFNNSFLSVSYTPDPEGLKGEIVLSLE